MLDKPIEVLILGGGFGGLYTAIKLSKSALVKQQKCKITLVEQKERFLFTPLLYELLTAELQPWEIAPSYQKLLTSTPINFCQQRVNSIDLAQRRVTLANQQSLSYDYLVLALGSENRRATVTGSESVLYFRTLADAELLNERLKLLEYTEKRFIRVGVVGGGANGVELACKLAARLGDRADIYLLEKGTQLLKHFSRGVQTAANRAIMKRKITVIYDSQIREITPEKIILTNQTIPIDLVIWTVGTQPLSWLTNLDCQQTPQGKLLTTSTLQLLNYPEVFTLGDILEIPHQIIPQTAQAAYQAANCVAVNLQAQILGKPLKTFRYLHLGDMLTLGKKAAVISCYGFNLEGFIADKIRRLVYIQRLPTQRHRYQVLSNVLGNSLLRKLRFCRWQLKRFLSLTLRARKRLTENKE
ncbi:MAG: NAD(P)/FAD-dependent oxidoreductase [Gloeocapsa sp. DLM2.Bin57]|nr:MAG: NAD(P)/FAD-dependent oxidoreductase [Gloeocapsa sp. DLM2.Bin57]